MYHLDIKPDNVMTTQEGRVVLLDFGAAKQADETTKIKTIKSSVAFSEDYAPIELKAGEKELIGSGTDIFEVGMVLHEMLTGERPPTPLNRLLSDKNWQPSLAEPWKSLVEVALRMEVGDRPKNIEAWWGRYHRATSAPPENLDEQMTLLLNQQEMERGCNKSVKLSEGTIEVKIPAGVREGQKLRIVGKGKRSSKGGERGSLYLEIQRQVLSYPRFKYETVQVDETGNIITREEKEAEYFVEELGNGIRLEMVRIVGGKLMMGSPEGEANRGSNESPQHEVSVGGFWMGRYAVTQEQWEAVMGNNPSDFKGGKRPVENVSWEEAKEYCRKLSEKVGREYRLPSEAEWEYACRAGTETAFYYGATLSTEVANYDGNYTYGKGKKGRYRQETVEVGSFPANGWGLNEMHGNVWEWCEDDYHNSYEGAPKDGRAWVDGGSNTTKVIRGGSWNFTPRNCRSASRYYYIRGRRYVVIGFRVVSSAPGLP